MIDVTKYDIYDSEKGDYIDEYGKIKAKTDKAIMVENRGWIPLSIIDDIIFYNGMNEGSSKRFVIQGELPQWFLGTNPSWNLESVWDFKH